MAMYYLFPFGKIHRGAKVIIYGAGAVGQWFLAQLNDTEFAEVVAIADRAWGQYPDLKVKLIPPDRIVETKFDKIIIAIEKPGLAMNIMQFLINSCHICENKIIWGCEKNVKEPVVVRSLPFDTETMECVPFAFQKRSLSLAAFLPGGLGDDIISKKFLEDLRSFTDDTLHIDLYCTKRNRGYAEAIFQEDWYQIYAEPVLYNWNKTKYDIALIADYILKFDHVATNALGCKEPRLAELIEQMQDCVDRYGLNAMPLCEYSIHFMRSYYRKWNAYDAIGHGLLDNNDNHVSIPLQVAGSDRFREMKFPNSYVTLNYGWGTQDVKKGLPAKVWPLHYYEELVKKVHNEFPELPLVQLGTSRSTRIDGADFFINEENLETVKYILQHSRLHIDCEGGLVHLATQLGTKCAVLFGPTSESYFGYKENINICARVCRPCYYTYNDFTICARGLREPECMLSITSEMVMEKIRDYLKNIR